MAIMRLSRRLKKIATGAVDLAIILIEDTIESWSSTETREGLQKTLRTTSERAAELAVENTRLEDELDKLRFNGPSLWKDEVEMLQGFQSSLHIRVASELTADLDRDRARLETITRLLDRCDHMPMTASELDVQTKEIMDGTITAMSWEEMFRRPEYAALPCDHTDEYGSMMLDGACMGCGVAEVAVGSAVYGHNNPPPGYAKCTCFPHDSGPCAHPVDESIEGIMDILFGKKGEDDDIPF